MDTVSYDYDSTWGDLLNSYDGVNITSDPIGNVLDDGTWDYTWEHGRQLASMTGNGTTWSYSYDAEGMRYKRTNGTTTYTYYYNGSLLRYLDINGAKLYFVLDANGQPIEVSYKPANSSTTSFYFYVHNLQGDVIAIVDTNGSTVVQYTYDAWGKLLSTTGSMASTLGQQNPFRYRSYVYDQETGLYYLQSRYYNPTIGRFINADVLVSTGQGILGNNMFAYCRNNPVCRKDISGTTSVEIFDSNGNLLTDEEEYGGSSGGGGAAASITAIAGMTVGTLVAGTIILHETQKKKPVNLPSLKKLTLDMEHISSGHMPGGSRNPKGNKDVFWGLTTSQVMNAIYDAYRYASKLKTQGNSIKVIGYSQNYHLWIEMWVDVVEHIINTAYPKG